MGPHFEYIKCGHFSLYLIKKALNVSLNLVLFTILNAINLHYEFQGCLHLFPVFLCRITTFEETRCYQGIPGDIAGDIFTSKETEQSKP